MHKKFQQKIRADYSIVLPITLKILAGGHINAPIFGETFLKNRGVMITERLENAYNTFAQLMNVVLGDACNINSP